MPAYEPSQLPPGDADFEPSDDQATADLLTLAWQFFCQASPAVREELHQFLTHQDHHPTTGPSAFLDRLQFTALTHHRAGEPPAN
jgi:hypothetical protein